MLLAQIITFIINFFQLIYLARVLAPENFGVISFVQTILFYVLIFSNLGISFMGTRELAVTHAFDSVMYWNITIFRLLLAGVCIVISYFWFVSVGEDNSFSLILIIYLCTLFPSILTPDWVFNGLEMMKINSVIKILVAAIGFGLVLFFVKSPSDLMFVPGAILVSLIIGAILGMIFLKKSEEKWDIQIRPSLWVEYIRRSMNIAFTSYLIVIIGTIDVFMIGILLSDTEVGYYSAASKLILSFHTMFNLIVVGIFPIVTRIVHSNPNMIKTLSSPIISCILALEIPFCLVISLNSDLFIHLLYGVRYEATIPVLAILIWSIIPYSLCNVYTTILNATYRESMIVKILTLQLVFLIPTIAVGTKMFGIKFTAWAVIIIGIVISILYATMYRKEIIIPFWNVLKICALCMVLLGIHALLHQFTMMGSFESVFRIGSLIVLLAGIILFNIVPIRQIYEIVLDYK